MGVRDVFSIRISRRAVFISISLSIIILGVIAFQFSKEQIFKERVTELSVIADAKLKQLREWRENRVAIASMLSENDVTVNLLHDFLINHNKSHEHEIYSLFKELIENFDFSNALLCDSTGRILFSFEEHDSTYINSFKDNLSKYLDSRFIDFSQMHYSEKTRRVLLELYVPLKLKGARNNFGIAAIEIDPDKYLFPTLTFIPLETASCEALIIRVEKDSVRFLNQLRFRKTSDLRFALPITSVELPAARAARGETGILEGKDYRDVEVLAYVEKIPTTQWALIVKIDKSEIYKPLIIRAIYIALTSLSLIIVTGFLFLFNSKNEKMDFYKKQYELENEKRLLTEHYKSRTRLANDIILLMSPAGEIIEVNEKAITTYGYSYDEFRNMPVSELRAPITIGAVSEQLNITREKESYIFETVHKTKDGTEFPVEVSTGSIEMDGKKYIQSFIRDISERKRNLNRIQNLNRVLAVLSNINQTIVRIKDRQALLDNACKIAITYGKFSLAWIGFLNEKTNKVTPEAAAGVMEYLKDFIIDIAEPAQLNGPVSNVLRTGKHFVYQDIENITPPLGSREKALKYNLRSVGAFPITQAGKTIGVIAFYADETNFFDNEECNVLDELAMDISFALDFMEGEKMRKLFEEEMRKYHRAVEQSPLSIFITDVEGNIEFVNKKFTVLTGYSFEEAIGKNPRILQSGFTKPEVYKDLWTTILSGREWNGELLNKKKNNDFFWEAASISPVFLDKEITHFVAVKEDITEKKLMHEQLIESKEKAERANQLKSEFLAQMSHEIRTPINVIVSFLGLINEEDCTKKNDTVQLALNSIHSSSNRITRTIDMILNMSELQIGSYETIFSEFDIYDTLLAHLLNEFRQPANAKNILLNYVPDTDKLTVYADEYSVGHIFSNLIDNAIKYTENGEVTLHPFRNGKDELVIEVSDSGIGISEEYIENLFDPFTQEEQGYTRRYEGNGLGLAIVKKYCDINNIEINVKSKKGVGTTFTLLFKNHIKRADT